MDARMSILEKPALIGTAIFVLVLLVSYASNWYRKYADIRKKKAMIKKHKEFVEFKKLMAEYDYYIDIFEKRIANNRRDHRPSGSSD